MDASSNRVVCEHCGTDRPANPKHGRCWWCDKPVDYCICPRNATRKSVATEMCVKCSRMFDRLPLDSVCAECAEW